jgi:serine/threonine protein kinase/tetratricopeptide (TPR) repeat protein
LITCPTTDELQQFLDETLDADSRELVDSHVDQCELCQDALEKLAQHVDLESRVRSTTSPRETTEICFPGPPSFRGPLGTFETYHIAEIIGRGAFGHVFRAWDETTDRQVAIKVLRPEYAVFESHRARFDREGKAASAIRHPNVVTVYRVGSLPNSNLPYIVMEHVSGETLEARLRREQIVPPAQTVSIMRQIAAGLAAAHEVTMSDTNSGKQGFVHRDVKPSNIMLDASSATDPLARITDFGLARPISTGDVELSRSDEILGSLPYMSPEQIQSPLNVDGRSDIYSLGIVAYEMLSGRRPYQAATPADVIRLIYETTAQGPARYNSHVPRDLDTIVLKCMSLEPSQRYPSAREVVDDLDRFLRGQPIHARPVASTERFARWARRNPAVATLSAVVLLIMLGSSMVFFTLWRRTEVQRQRAEDAEREVINYLKLAMGVQKDVHKAFENELLRAPGLQPLRQQVLGTIRNYDEQFVQLRPFDPVRRWHVGDTLLRLALIASELETGTQAIALCQKSVDVFDQLARDYPGETSYVLAFREAQIHLAVFQLKTENSAQAASLVSEVVRALEEQERRQPDSQVRSSLADALNNASIFATHAGRLPEAIENLQRCILLREKIRDANPGDAHNRRAISSAYNNLAANFTRLDDATRANEAYENSLRNLREILAQQANDVLAQAELVRTLSNYGFHLSSRHQLADAEAKIRECIDVAETLVRQNPQVTDYRAMLAHAQLHLLQVTARTSRIDEALQLGNAALATLGGLIELDPSDPDHENSLGRAHKDFASLCAALNRWDEAEQHIAAARTHYEHLAGQHEDILEYHDHLAETLQTMGRFARDMGKMDQADEHYEMAAEIHQRLVEKAPGNRSFRFGHIAAVGNLGILRFDQGRLAEALEHIQQTILDLDELLKIDPASPEARSMLVSGHNSLGNIYDRLRQPEDAEAAYRRAVVFARQLTADQPDDTSSAKLLSHCLNNLAQYINNDPARSAEAIAVLQQSQAVVEALVARDSRDTEAVLTLSSCLNDLGNMHLRADPDKAEPPLSRAEKLMEAVVSQRPALSEGGLIYAAIIVNLARCHEARQSYGTAIERLESKAIPKLQALDTAGFRGHDVRDLLSEAYLCLASSYLAIGKIAESDAAWDQLLQRTSPSELPARKLKRARGWARSGQYQRAVDELQRLFPAEPTSFEDAYHLACVYALASEAAATDESLDESRRATLTKEYATRAIHGLQQLQKRGLVPDEQFRQLIESDANLDPIRGRPDFQSIQQRPEICWNRGTLVPAQMHQQRRSAS